MRASIIAFPVACFFVMSANVTALAQETATPKTTPPAKVKYLDPAEFYPPALLQVIDVDVEIALSDLPDFLKQHGATCILEHRPLREGGVELTQRAKLSQVPLYLALTRYCEALDPDIEIAWYLNGDIVLITLIEAAEANFVTRVYDTSSLTKLNIEADKLIELIWQLTGGIAWYNIDGYFGSMDVIQNALVVRHSPLTHEKIARLICALQATSQIVYVNDPPEHAALRKALEKKISVDFENSTLSMVADALSDLSGVPVELDVHGLEEYGWDNSDSITFAVSDQSMNRVCELLFSTTSIDISLLIVPHNGTLLITTQGHADEKVNTVVFNISDSVGNSDSDANEIIEIIKWHTAGSWIPSFTNGTSIESAPHGKLVITNSETVIKEVIQLLENLKPLVKAPTPEPPKDPDSVETHYYRVASETAADLALVIPEVISTGTWKTLLNSKEVGSIYSVRVVGEIPGDAQSNTQSGGVGFFQFNPLPSDQSYEADPKEGGQTPKATGSQLPTDPLVGEHTVMIITQTVAVHEEIQKFLNQLLHVHPDGPQ